MLPCLYLLAAALLLGFCGFGLAALTLPVRLRHYTLSLSPWIGASYLTCAAYFLYLADRPGTDSYAFALLIPPALLTCVALRRGAAARCFRRETVWALAPMLLAFMLASVLAARMGSHPASMSRHNNDIADYATTAVFAKEHSRSETAGFWGQQSAVREEVDSNWTGVTLLMALLSSFLFLHPWETGTLFMQAAYLSIPGLAYVLSRTWGRMRPGPSALAASILALHPLFRLLMWEGFGGQLLGMGFALLLVLAARIGLPAGTLLPSWRAAMLFLAALWGLLVSYPIMLPLAFGLAFLAGPFEAMLRGEFRTAGRNAAAWLLLAVLGAFLFLPRTLLLAGTLRTYSQSQNGGFFPLINAGTLLGFFQLPSLETVTAALGTLALAGLAAAAWLTWRSPRALSWIATILAVAALSLASAWLEQKNGQWGGYKSFKLATFSLPILLVAGTALCCRARRHLPRLAPAAAMLAATVLGASLLSGLIVENLLVAKNRRFGISLMTPELAGLHAVNTWPDIGSINVGGLTFWEEMWAPALLDHERLYFDRALYACLPAAAPQGRWDLIRLPNDRLFRPLSAQGDAIVPERLSVNAVYALERHDAAAAIQRIAPGEGWWPAQENVRWTNADGKGKPFEVRVFSLRELPVEVACDPTLRPGEILTVSQNGKPVARLAGSAGEQHWKTVLAPGENLFLFNSNQASARQIAGDRRLLGSRFTLFTVRPLRETPALAAPGPIPG